MKDDGVAGMSEIEQLQKFVEWEREHNPDKTHVAEWALTRISELEGYRSESEQQFQEKVEEISELEAEVDYLKAHIDKFCAQPENTLLIDTYRAAIIERDRATKANRNWSKDYKALQAKLDSVEQQDSEYTRKLEVAVTAASLLPEKWRGRRTHREMAGVGALRTLDRCADELEQAIKQEKCDV